MRSSRVTASSETEEQLSAKEINRRDERFHESSQGCAKPLRTDYYQTVSVRLIGWWLLIGHSLRSWRYCKRTRNKVLAAWRSERRSREENGEWDFEIPPAGKP